MSVTYGLDKAATEGRESAVAVGVFDGVHWGHRAIFERLIAAARELDAKSVALTFDRHPVEVLAPTRAPQYINTLEQRVELIRAVDVDEVVVAEFTPELAALPREDFVRGVLIGALKAKHVVVGSNFRFGRNREGDTRYLQSFLPELGVGISVVSAVIIGGGPASSTRVRMLVSRGDIEEAAKILGRRFTLRGIVVKGEQVGRAIGFPTSNIQVGARQLLPARGVYVVEAAIHGTTYKGVCNIGVRPTFRGERETVEVHLDGFQGTLYGETLDVVFCRRLRDEMTFESPEKLADQIRKDLERAGGPCE
ncbi:MAG: bifunctional riboflavin kinase/FAD synthetase [Armatimonadetes bacterium]|nr:bifunctional riboflavin kinase/FAD synthetase [Armatimonadota bacterium]